ncbi:hypothetical protein OHU34_23895 [Streptomyces sp. NBC_00080]|uniref:hypothetical protein n=1 Tax=Streptomyces TaxID=1883 RepID=UPI00114DAAB4|nr:MULTISPECIES: hypothetical protein [Streptomyces]TQJ53781.1 hypothetical protein FBY34_1523 [Streptomyces sp. SLBN-115]
MSNTEKQTTQATADITTLENHAPILPALSKPATPEAGAATPAAEEKIVTLENHAPVPPALDLDGK